MRAQRERGREVRLRSLALLVALLITLMAAPRADAAIDSFTVSTLQPKPGNPFTYTGTYSASVGACTPYVNPITGFVYSCYVQLFISVGWEGVSGVVASKSGEFSSGVSLSGTFETGKPNVPAYLEARAVYWGVNQPSPVIARLPLCFSDDPAGCSGGSGPGSSPGSGGSVQGANAELIRGLKRAKEELERQRQQMLDAKRELEDKNNLFCVVSGQLLKPVRAPKYGRRGWGQICGKIPDLVSAYVDAERKLERNRELIDKLDAQIKALEGASASRVRASISGATRAAGTGRTAARTKGSKRLRSLRSARVRALDAMDKLAVALGKGDFAGARGLAGDAATRLEALRRTCKGAKRGLKREGLGTRLARNRIRRELRRLKGGSVPRRLVQNGRALRLTKAQLKRRIRAAKAIPAKRIKTVRGSELICSPRLEAIDRSLAAALRALAQAL